MFKRVLIANRGEIAIRIARAAQSLGVESVAVYPHADRGSLHVQYATHSQALTTPKGASSVSGYLDVDQLIQRGQGNGLRLRASGVWLSRGACGFCGAKR